MEQVLNEFKHYMWQVKALDRELLPNEVDVFIALIEDERDELREEVEQLKDEIESLKDYIGELEDELAEYRD